MTCAPQIVPATQVMLEALDQHPAGAGRAYAAVLEGRALGVCGYYHDRSRLILYAKADPELRRWKKVIVRAAKMALAAASQVRAPVVALCDSEIPGSARMLEALGFEHVEQGIYWRPTWRQPARS